MSTHFSAKASSYLVRQDHRDGEEGERAARGNRVGNLAELLPTPIRLQLLLLLLYLLLCAVESHIRAGCLAVAELVIV